MELMTLRTDIELVELARHGNPQAFKLLILRHQKLVASTVIGMLGNTIEAEDVGQETFIRFYRALPNFRGDSAVGTYLTRIAINLSLNELKRRKKRSFLSFFTTSNPKNKNDHEIEMSIPDETETPEKYDSKELVQKALSCLDPKFRSVVVLRLVKGYSSQETADLLDLPIGTVLSRLARAQDKLKQIIDRLQN
ncbi:MAG: sigma-70 family RNA polymerase sigma factor [Sphingobacteriales bacterium]|nr:MAG: sigma-70 family RNA polymerase sigma factor [Sphingobacteriales bacterium]